MFDVIVYTVWNTTVTFHVEGLDKAREYAKRIVAEGLWKVYEDCEVFVPVHNLVKVKIIKAKAPNSIAKTDS